MLDDPWTKVSWALEVLKRGCTLYDIKYTTWKVANIQPTPHIVSISTQKI